MQSESDYNIPTPGARPALARTALRRPLMSRPSETETLLQQAGKLLEQDQFADALPVIEQVLKLDPRSDVGLWYRGCALSALGRYAEAAGAYLELSKVAPGRAIVWYNLGNALQN